MIVHIALTYEYVRLSFASFSYGDNKPISNNNISITTMTITFSFKFNSYKTNGKTLRKQFVLQHTCTWPISFKIKYLKQFIIKFIEMTRSTVKSMKTPRHEAKVLFSDNNLLK